jgi:hypothetical protein
VWCSPATARSATPMARPGYPGPRTKLTATRRGAVQGRRSRRAPLACPGRRRRWRGTALALGSAVAFTIWTSVERSRSRHPNARRSRKITRCGPLIPVGGKVCIVLRVDNIC